ncbi:ectonucleotide pyrophosphatase/phosphodiesterase [Alistipes sp.]|uniref:alkaline phosphatase family protein n=1 Tax=Alistipes sp. TaxID=1872444 RepID=UPI0025BE401F|nr:ectonucleotide pyrophosphatase/phosphodiesterase [Alistipes sp.]
MMRSTALPALLALLLLTGCAAARRAPACTSARASARASGEKQYVVILSMDAFRWDLADRARTPTLDSLRRAGCYAEIYPVFPSNTFPSHYSMATGLHPDRHGVVNNSFYDRTEGRTLSVFDARDVLTPGFWGGEPIWNTAERQGLTAHIFMWPGSEVPVGGRQATVWTRYSARPSYRERADWVVEAMTRPEEEIPDLVMWYFEQPDAAMHAAGPASPQAVAQAERIDSALCHFFREIRRSPVFERINFIVTADHGMTELAPERCVNLYGLLDTAQVVRTVAGNPLGIEVREGYTDEALRLLRRTPHLRAWHRDRMPRRLRYGTRRDRLANLIVLPDAGWTLDYSPSARPLGKRGAHGYDPRERDMHMVFYASGPAFRKGYSQRSFQNHHIYLLLCRLLNIEPAPNDCRDRAFEGMLLPQRQPKHAGRE